MGRSAVLCRCCNGENWGRGSSQGGPALCSFCFLGRTVPGSRRYSDTTCQQACTEHRSLTAAASRYRCSLNPGASPPARLLSSRSACLTQKSTPIIWALVAALAP